ncbi:heme exporter protein CcmD [Paraburkholderia saeva]|jgi:heme exporter protein CcmD|uniref:Heme exporter protein D n=1 Tax=Paraburkholderia saeva TaxID=2777537 RepID=A0A9N8X1R6_9BURK|nr:heme exporter protein CcmD [Paraburkholderia saeva]CAG4888234.1 hypothetical protein R52603_00611 [Paraburkholderia saeva]CAG4895476.1 hypothetical protein LMG31841_02155 [Paraburkholderia saeva]CAG4897325.1 hypothetical protein R70241_02310 [Paraburkholderia saeva]
MNGSAGLAHAPFVWAAFGITFVLLAFEVVLVWLASRRAAREPGRPHAQEPASLRLVSRTTLADRDS